MFAVPDLRLYKPASAYFKLTVVPQFLFCAIIIGSEVNEEHPRPFGSILDLSLRVELYFRSGTQAFDTPD